MRIPVFFMGENHGIRLVSGSGLVVFLLNPLKPLPLRLVTKRDLECFFESMHEVYHENVRKLPAEWLMKLGSLRKTLERLSSRTYGPLKGLTFTDRKLLHFGFALTSRPLSEPKQPVTYFSSVLLQGVNPGDSRYTGTVVFLPDPAAFTLGQWS